MNLIHRLATILGIAAATSVAPAAATQTAIEQAVIVRFNYGSRDLAALHKLEDKIEAAIAKAKAGEYDGHEIAVDGSDCLLYMYGPDADRLFDVAKRILEAAKFMKGAKVVKRYGPPAKETKETTVFLKS